MADHHQQEAKKLHIAMFPWLAFGHMIPFLELSKLLAQKGHTISFISTTRNIDRLPKPPQSLLSFIRFVRLTLPRVENLPEAAESTTDCPIEAGPYLKLAFDMLQDQITEFLETHRPDWIFYDFAPYWLPDVCRSLSIPNGFFSPLSAAAISFWALQDENSGPENFTSPPKGLPFPTTLAFKPYELERLLEMSPKENPTKVSEAYRGQKVQEDCGVIAIRSSREMEGEWLDVLEKRYRKPILPVGLLLPAGGKEVEEENQTWLSIKAWLDSQEKESVVYVVFGSEAIPKQNELTEIALGLELSGLPFFWALKTRRGPNDPNSVELLEGFEERTRGRGMVWRSWVPQPRVLSHDSVGGVLTHPGWGTVLETIHSGKTPVMLTFVYDQALNARIFEEKKIGYMVPRDERDGSFTKEAVAESLRMILVEEEGKVYREKFREVKAMCGGEEMQEKYINDFLDHLYASIGKN